MFVGMDGRLTVQGNGVRLDDGQIAGRRTRLALTFLVLERRRAIPSEELADVLWWGRPRSSSTSSLREVLTLVRRVLAAVGCHDAVTTRNRCIHVTLPEDLVVDVEQALAAAVRLGAAVDDDAEVFRLAECVLAATSTPPLPDEDGSWLTTLRTNLWLARMTAFAAVAEAHLAAGRPDLALSPARALIDAEPLQESGHELLMRGLAALGRSVDALATYRRYRDLLVREVGLDPPQGMQRLQLEMLGHGSAGEAPAADAGRARAERTAATGGVAPGCPRPPRAPDDRIPFVGRADVLRDLAGAVRQQPRGHPGVVVLTGETGVGKTRLLSELIGDPLLSHHATRYGCCLASGRRGAALLQALGGWDGKAGGRNHDEWVALSRLQALADAQPVLLVLDDMHAADLVTTRFVALLARAQMRSPVTLVVTARDDEASPALRAIHADLHRVAKPREVVLGPLGDGAIRELARAVLGRPLPAARADQLALDSGGIPLYLVGIAEAIRDGDFDRGGVDATTAVASVVRHRLESLSVEATELLSVAALAGPEFSLSSLTRALGVEDPVRWIPVVEELLDRGVLAAVEADGELRLRFRHGIVAAVVHGSLSRLRRSFLAGRLLDLDHAQPRASATQLAAGRRDTSTAGGGRALSA